MRQARSRPGQPPNKDQRSYIARVVVRVTALAAVAAVAVVGLLPQPAPASAFITSKYLCPSLASNTWCIYNERHSYRIVVTGQNNWASGCQYGDFCTSQGWWCSKLLNQDTGVEYGRICDWSWIVKTDIGTPPSSHMLPLSANGNNGTRQDVLGCARTSLDYHCSIFD